MPRDGYIVSIFTEDVNMKRVWTYLCGAGISLAALFFAASGSGQELPAVPPVPDVPAVEPAKDAAEPVKDAVEPAKDAVKDAADTAKDAVEPAKDAARDATGAARDATRDAAGAARDAARDVREGARDTAREGVRDVREGARDTVRDVREGVRDTARDARDTVRDVRGSVNASGSARANLRWQDMQSADVGLWFNRDTRDGLVIADIATQGPIAKLGFQEGDRIVSVGGQRIARQADFMRYLFSSNVRGRVPVIVLRGGQETTIYMEPQVFLTHVNSYQTDPLENFGIILDDRAADRIVVWRVIPRSPAFFAGIRSGDVLVSFNKQPIQSSAQLIELAGKAQVGPIDVEVQRGDRTRSLELDLQARAGARTGNGLEAGVGAEADVETRSAMRPDYDSAPPALEQPASGYINRGYNYGRRGLFRWRR